MSHTMTNASTLMSITVCDPNMKGTGLEMECLRPSMHIPELVLIPPIYVLIISGFLCTLVNAFFNYVSFGRSSITTAMEKHTRVKMLIHHSLIVRDMEGHTSVSRRDNIYNETDHLLTHSNVSVDHNDSAVFFQGILNSDALGFESPRVPASVADEALYGSLECIRRVGQQIVFSHNPKYMIISITKSLVMLLVLQYHFDYNGGWDRFVVCTAANLMSGLLTPVLEYGAEFLLQLDPDSNLKVAQEHDELDDVVLISRILTRIGEFKLEDLETVLVQGCTFIVFGAVLLPPVFVFCLVGAAMFLWLFGPLWFAYGYFRHLYYKPRQSKGLSSPNARGWLRITPFRELARIVLLKAVTLFLLQWTVQCSFLLGLMLLQGESYLKALHLEVKHQLWRWNNPLKMGGFRLLCLVSQLLF
ncbi:uncharacterized protein TEOVI_000294900 [Trypanosoma equiperdum]|uniref:Uncharacterized protein n=4 Tax=Trypanozoon TaxID=39700 RepID=Q387C8_TRYB2|nr:hypothetical protein, conserved [Trypanosoma brucei gambiense DAL972]XP_828215.1 hypothetical protein, conserved [Trypanosoma brucei brucei TREU927]RHW67444.1 hypothetical protein DPX39_110018800 [Trypanosoma brucei equiperdum]SCU71368.1 hypothetical protein, conserved [Trypanosoma equiperdum]EAN79103.1 hypothetical protein, conserved [Trypanosoma brucei brucei TREU927]CBH17015.1 hypothetical protein, conserved [Trypanosoma brucei gambiense DAL972]|eukprot:XP_011779279.1 hypothetical protein, conserved [Trypanosoma brucei gambiense DAL972]